MRLKKMKRKDVNTNNDISQAKKGENNENEKFMVFGLSTLRCPQNIHKWVLFLDDWFLMVNIASRKMFFRSIPPGAPYITEAAMWINN